MKELLNNKEIEQTPVDKTTDISTDVAPVVVSKRKKSKRSVPAGQVHIFAGYNNTIITITDPKGQTLATASAGSSGFRGSKKGTAYAAQVAADKVLASAKQTFGMTKVDVFVKGTGLGRDSAIRTLATAGVGVDKLVDITGVAHGGVRPRKARRV